MQTFRRALPLDVAVPLLIAVVVVAANFALEPSLLSVSNITQLSVQIAPFILLAFAQTMAMLLAGIDLAVGAMASLASALVATNLGARGIPSVLLIAVVLAVTGILGCATGAFISVFRVPALVVTLAASFIWGGAALVILPQPGGEFPKNLITYFTGTYYGVPMAILILGAIAVLVYFAQNTSPMVHVYAYGNNALGAELSGLSHLRSHLVAYGLGGVFAGFGGVFLAAQTNSGDPSIGNPFTLSSIAAAVIGGVSLFGGRGRFAGAACGAVVIGMLTNLLIYAGASSFMQTVLQGVVLLLIVCVAAWQELIRARRVLIGRERGGERRVTP